MCPAGITCSEKEADQQNHKLLNMVTHIKWCVNVTKWKPSKEEWLALTSSIASEELERINKFQFQDDAKSSLLGCALIRKFLFQTTKTPSNELALTRNQWGRPVICNQYRIEQKHWPVHIDFNVSHSGDYCVLAGLISSDKQRAAKVGVDVHKIIRHSGPELSRFLDLMKKREFKKAEWETVEQAAGDRQKCINFTRLWCLKESYIKAIGLGLSFQLNRIDFRFPVQHRYHISMDKLKNGLVEDTTVLLDGELAADWSFYLTALDDQHIVALAHKFETSQRFKLEDSRFDELQVSSIIDSLAPVHVPDVKNWDLFSARGLKNIL